MSGRKNVILPFHLVSATSMAADITSIPTNGTFQDNVGIQVKWVSSDGVGVISIQGSINAVVNQAGTLVSGDWYDLTFNPVLTQPNSNSGGYLINLNQVPYNFIRVKYTRTSGTGTFDAWITEKEI